MSKKQEQDRVADDFICVEPDVGASDLYDYLAETLSKDQRQQFEDHLIFCRKCQDDLQYMRWVVDQLKAHVTHQNRLEEENIQAESPQTLSSQITDNTFLRYIDTPLPVSAAFDGNAQNLIHDYQKKPLMDQLAASAETSLGLTFPITLEYADGQIIGQFRKRAGQLFYKLQKSTVGQEKYRCTLLYTSRMNPSDIKTFELREGEDKRIGNFVEIVPANTIRGMLDVMKQFQLLLKRIEH